jgi:hypothetical protein
VDDELLRLWIEQHVEVCHRNGTEQHFGRTGKNKSPAGRTPVFEMKIGRADDFTFAMRTIGKFDFS